jgi:hypothetical protein
MAPMLPVLSRWINGPSLGAATPASLVTTVSGKGTSEPAERVWVHALHTVWLASGFLLGCGGRAGSSRPPPAAEDTLEGSPGDAGGADAPGRSGTSEGGNVSGGSPGLGPICDSAGTRRPATAAEMSQYCVCESMAEDLIWECYGPSPSASKPQATCMYTDVNPGTGQGSCFVNWSSCSDGNVYSFTCIDHVCNCFVQGKQTMFAIEARDTCPESKQELDTLCGWDLQ